MTDDIPDEVNEKEDESSESSNEKSQNEEHSTISETVKNISSKSLKQIAKWNNESFLYAFDRQLISFGIRLLLFLPGFAILAFFGAWAYANSSPNWWVDFIEPTIGQSFSSILVALINLPILVTLGSVCFDH